jgi:ABC-2 type transport system permease protein
MVVQLKEARLQPVALLTTLLSPVVFGLLAFAIVGRPSAALVVGVGCAAMWETLILQLILMPVRERSAGTLLTTLASPSPLVAPFLGRVAASVLLSLPALVVPWIIVAVVWELPPLGSPLLLAAGLLVVVLGFAGAGTVVAAGLAMSRYYEGMFNGLFPVTVLLSGLLVPTAALPVAGRWTSHLLGAAWGMEALRSASWAPAAPGAVVDAAWLAVGVLFVRRVEFRLRQDPERHLQ